LDAGPDCFFRGVRRCGFVTRMRLKKWPDDLKADASQSTTAVSSLSLGNRCAGISVGPFRRCTSPESPCDQLAADEVVLNLELHVEANGHTSRIAAALFVLAPGPTRRAVEPRKTEGLALIPLMDPRGRCLRFSVGHCRTNRDGDESNGHRLNRADRTISASNPNQLRYSSLHGRPAAAYRSS